MVHKLKGNDENTVILQVLAPRSALGPGDCRILAGSEPISLTEVGMNLGVLFDRYLKMEAHVRYTSADPPMLGSLALRAYIVSYPQKLLK